MVAALSVWPQQLCSPPHCTLLLFGQITEFEYTRAVLCAKYADPLSSVYSTHS